MAEIIDMPKLSDTMTTGTLVAWLKKEGETIASGDMVAEVETDKATMEVESFSDGVMLKHYIAVGDQLPVGAPLCAIGEAGESAPEVAAPAPAAEPAAPAAEPAPTAPEPAPAAPAPAASPAPAATPAPAPVAEDGGRIKASPMARRLAAEKGVNLAGLQGSGPGGRILKADVLGAPAGAAPAAAGSAPARATGEDRKIPVSNMRSVIARRLLESKTTVPHFYLEMSVDTAPLLRMRGAINRKLASLEPEQGGIKLTVNDLILKATVEALRRVPAVNASWMNDHILEHGSVNLAFGVAIDDGLVTPVIRAAEHLGVRELSVAAKDLINRARNKKLKPDEMSGSTFTVTNLGMFGVKNFFGIINPPNAGILSVSASEKIAVVDEEGQIVPGERMSLGFSGDHRVVDGATGAQFLAALKEVLETPELILV